LVANVAELQDESRLADNSMTTANTLRPTDGDRLGLPTNTTILPRSNFVFPLRVCPEQTT
jgi:hypothetical protein